MLIVGLGISCEQIPREERTLRFLSFVADVGKRPLEDTGSPVKFSVCVWLIVSSCVLT